MQSVKWIIFVKGKCDNHCIEVTKSKLNSQYNVLFSNVAQPICFICTALAADGCVQTGQGRRNARSSSSSGGCGGGGISSCSGRTGPSRLAVAKTAAFAHQAPDGMSSPRSLNEIKE